MSIETNKLVNLGDAQVLYNDLRGRVDSKANTIAVTDETSEAVKTFTDGADGMPMEVTVGIEPVQDLHGYDHPWAGGAGKNLMPNITAVRTEGEAIWIGQTDNTTYPIHLEANQAYTVSFTSNVTGAVYFKKNGGSNTRFGANEDTYTPSETMDVQMWVYATSGLTSVTNVQLEKGSTATSYEPYSNICPISGWNATKIFAPSKNLFSGVEQGSIDTATGKNKYSDSVYRAKYKIKVEPSGTYTISGLKTATGTIRIFYYGTDGSYLNNGTKSATNNAITITVDETVGYIRFQGASSVVDENAPIQIEVGSSATQYEAIRAFNVSFPVEAGTVYGGTLTVNKDGTGKLYVPVKFYTFDGTESWAIGTNVVYEFSDMKSGSNLDGYCSMLQVGTSSGYARFGLSNNKFYIVAGSTYYGLDTKEKAQAFTTGMQIVYPLATPVEYDLTAEQIKSLLGTNNVWADCGNVKSVDYSADTKMYIDNEVDTVTVFTETVSGTTPTITGVANHRYICGECATLSITPPASGVIDVIFESGSTATVLTLPNTVKLPEWFEVEADKAYEINIMDGVYGSVMAWA